MSSEEPLQLRVIKGDAPEAAPEMREPFLRVTLSAQSDWNMVAQMHEEGVLNWERGSNQVSIPTQHISSVTFNHATTKGTPAERIAGRVVPGIPDQDTMTFCLNLKVGHSVRVSTSQETPVDVLNRIERVDPLQFNNITASYNRTVIEADGTRSRPGGEKGISAKELRKKLTASPA